MKGFLPFTCRHCLKQRKTSSILVVPLLHLTADLHLTMTAFDGEKVLGVLPSLRKNLSVNFTNAYPQFFCGSNLCQCHLPTLAQRGIFFCNCQQLEEPTESGAEKSHLTFSWFRPGLAGAKPTTLSSFSPVSHWPPWLWNPNILCPLLFPPPPATRLLPAF